MSAQENSTPNAVEVLVALLSGGYQGTLGCMQKCAEDRRLFSLGDGKATPLWTVGHLACIADVLGRDYGLGKEPLFPKQWRQRFTPLAFGGTAITTDPNDYPTWNELSKSYEEIFSTYLRELPELRSEELGGPPRGEVPEPLQAMMPTLQDSIMINILHDSHHRGQLALLASCPGT